MFKAYVRQTAAQPGQVQTTGQQLPPVGSLLGPE